VRAEAMHAAARRQPGGMAAVVGLDLDKVGAIAEKSGVKIANDNTPDQVVLAGTEQGLADAARLVSEVGARSVLLQVSGPFHTVAVAAATQPLREALDAIEIREPSVPVVSNVTARSYESVEDIRSQLVRQLTSRVRWRESIQQMWKSGIDEFIDFGPGRVVGPLAQKTVRSLKREAGSAKSQGREVAAGV
ncbi:MAG: ACP S-malonyltransferase, partial [Actinomycetota bacterium]